MAMEERMPLNLDPSMMQTGQVKRGGMFGGNAGNFISNMILNYAAMQGNQGAASVLQSLNERRLAEAKQKYDEQQYQRQRSDGMSDWIAKQQYQAEHPNPVNNDTVADYQFIMQQLGPEAGKRFLETKTNPIVMTPYGPMPYSAVTGGAAPASRPVGRLTPIEDGGPTASPSAMFPRPY